MITMIDQGIRTGKMPKRSKPQVSKAYDRAIATAVNIETNIISPMPYAIAKMRK